MKFREEIQQAQIESDSTVIDEALSALSDEERSDLEECFRDAAISTTTIHRVLERRGIIVKYGRISEYRRRILNGHR